MTSPYAPPAADVSDPAELVGRRPQSVHIAALSLWVSAALAFVMVAIQVPRLSSLVTVGAMAPVQLVVTLATAIITVALLVLVAAKVNAGRGWARWLFLVVWIVGAGVMAAAVVYNPRGLQNMPPLIAASERLQWILQTTALVLMFVRPSREWFAAQKRR